MTIAIMSKTLYLVNVCLGSLIIIILQAHVATYCPKGKYFANINTQYLSHHRYSNNEDCTFDIESGYSDYSYNLDYFLEITWIGTFDVKGEMPYCNEDYVEVFLTRSWKSIGKFCSTNTAANPFNMYSYDGRIKIKFKSDNSGTGFGFRIGYKMRKRSSNSLGSSNCRNMNRYADGGNLFSPQYPNERREIQRAKCIYKMNVFSKSETKIVFMDINLSKSGPPSICNYEAEAYLTIYGSNSSDNIPGTRLGNYLCKTNSIVTIKTTNKYIYVFFKTTRNIAKGSRGFVAGYISYDKNCKSNTDCTNNIEDCTADCDFDQCGMCNWGNAYDSDVLDWRRQRGRNLYNFLIGPKTDHTVGSMGGYYLYIETAGTTKIGDNAILKSGTINGSSSPSCFEFWYHMKGMYGNINQLKISMGTMAGTKTVMWLLKGPQGSRWLRASVPIPASNGTFWIFMEGITGSRRYSRIAVDDLKYIYKSCELIPPHARIPGKATKIPWTRPKGVSFTVEIIIVVIFAVLAGSCTGWCRRHMNDEEDSTPTDNVTPLAVTPMLSAEQHEMETITPSMTGVEILVPPPSYAQSQVEPSAPPYPEFEKNMSEPWDPHC